MTLEESREDLKAQSELDLDLYKGLVLDSDGAALEEATGLTELISRACVRWASETYCCSDSRVPLTLTISTDEYDCRDLTIVGTRIVKPRTVVINDVPLLRRDGKRAGLWTLPELQHEYPQWRIQADGEPFLAVWQPNKKLLLYYSPEAVYSGKNFIDAWTAPDDLVVGTDDQSELPVPDEDHWAIIRLARVFGADPVVSENVALARLQRDDLAWREHAAKRRQENIAAHLGRRPRGYASRDWMY